MYPMVCFSFCSKVKEMISDGTGNAVELEGEGDGDTLEVSVCFWGII